ncbi:hypothetical protein AGABI1DRAFT_127857 [Agaricus bisporus var. burnettii JB137-S8]|uniref:DUF952 domain-containing protein n=2 Tax=Agaricus bisporus var. burnettii TaxID=192524 RepID=K5XXY8_AGABU|nr:uncharacterized protein AGABI1DRAFT_127857 [Agaricus bisporus var. burnettii JB137-S8]EKM80175.1 hypothetical protein AGABI1DRAFT_127857 [Agaricus bisporus var. burnettii JB137-S8]KAF7776046.1 hypothetical protein Agabi119p4_4439 [Agaricus bisporus var. burnettii]
MSNSESRLPDYVYKIVPSNSTPPSPLPHELPLSELDSQSGFIHLSTAPQIPGTLRLFFGTDEKVYILKMPFKPLQEKIRWESPDAKVSGPSPGEGLFPHLYGGKLGKDEVERVMTLNKGSGWDSVLEEAEDWLVY